MFEQRFEKLTSKEQDEFVYIANRLLAENYLLRDVYSNKEKAMKIQYDYRFIERHKELFVDYFRYSGWDLNVDGKYGVAWMINRYDLNRATLNKATTIFLLTLRLIYDEQREKLTMKREVLTSTYDVVGKLMSIGAVKKKPSDKDITDALRMLERYNIVTKLDGKWSDPDTQLIIYPTILFVMTNAKINDLHDLITSGNEEGSEGENADGEGVSETGNPEGGQAHETV